MALGVFDRLVTIVVTATVTSAAWIVAAGLGLMPHVPQPASAPVTPASSAPGVSTTVAPAAVPVVAPAGEFIVPVSGVRPEQLSDTFTQARAGGARVHDAIDIMAPAGTPVVAAAPGTIEKLFQSNDGGTTIYLRSPDRRTIHYYAHLQEYAPGLHEGQQVKQGELLGKVGSTGNANPAAPHLHFAVMLTRPEARWWDSTTAVNPYPLLVKHNPATNRGSE